MTVDDLRRMGTETGLTVVDHSHVSLYLASELIPGAATLNDIVSRALSDRPYAQVAAASDGARSGREVRETLLITLTDPPVASGNSRIVRELALDHAASQANVVIDHIIDAYSGRCTLRARPGDPSRSTFSK